MTGLRHRFRTGTLTEFKATSGRDNLLDVEHSATGYVFAFTMKTDVHGRLVLDGPYVTGVGTDWPDGKFQQRACDFAQVAAEEHRRQQDQGSATA